MDSIPKELIYDICIKLDAKSLSRFAQSNSHLYLICERELQTWRNKKNFELTLTSVGKFPTFYTQGNNDGIFGWLEHFEHRYIFNCENEDIVSLLSFSCDISRATMLKLNRFGFFIFDDNEMILDFYLAGVFNNVLRVDLKKKILTNTERISINQFIIDNF